MAALNVDIIYAIIDQLLTDSRALKSCSLVSRSWLQPSQNRLFRDIVVLSTVNNRQSFADFETFLASSPHLSKCVRKLTLQGGEPGAHRILFRRYDAPQLTLQRLWNLLQHLQSLRNLSLDNVLLVGGDFIEAVPEHARPSLDVLRLNPFNDTPEWDGVVGDTVNVLGLFSNIGHLFKSVEYWDHSYTRIIPRFSGPINIRSIEVDKAYDRRSLADFYDTIIKTGSHLGDLQALSVRATSRWCYLQCLGDFLGVAGLSLRHLRIVPVYPAICSISLQLIEEPLGSLSNLARCSNLESLAFVIELDSVARARGNVLFALYNCLYVLRELVHRHCPPALKRLAIRVDLDRDHLDQNTPSQFQLLEALDEAVCRIETLERFTMDFSGASDAFKQRLTGWLPGISQKGILSMKYEEEFQIDMW